MRRRPQEDPVSLDSFFNPRGVALIGSTSPGKLGHELLKQIVAGGYRNIYAVNPRGQGLAQNGSLTVPGFTALAEIDEPVDLVVIVSPPATVPSVMADCGRAGIKAAVIITAGFSEIGNHAGEAEIQQVAAKYGIRFIGPNCAGMLNTGARLFPTLETRPPAGHVSLIAQSGALGGVILAWAAQDGLGVSKFVSYGNRGDLGENELLRYLADDADTHVVGLYIESVRDGRSFMEAVRYCTRHKPVVVIKAGRTGSGQRATLSHTGSLAGADAVYDAALRQAGAIRVRTPEEMFDACKAFVGVPRLAGSRVAIVTNSGGPGVLAADKAEEAGLDVAEPGPGATAALQAFLPAHCAIKNPVDLTVEGTEAGYQRSLSILLEEFDAAVALNIAPPYLDSVPLARGICEAARSSGKPVLASFLPHPYVDDAIAYLEDHGVPNLATGERAVAAMGVLAAHAASRAACREPVPPAATAGRLPGQGQMLEPDAMAWLGENGLPVPEFRVAGSVEEAVVACRALGYPVVMKVVAPDILHKSDRGGVVVDIRDDDAATAAFGRIAHAAEGHDFRGVVIYPMIRDAQEVLLGLSRDPQFGPVVALGLGGIYTEILRDVSLRVAPVDREEAAAMACELNAFPLLAGARGQARRDLDALADVVARFSQLPFLYPDIAELDLNPIFLLAQGEGVLVGDVRVIREDG